ncbi:TerB family tellurite resistance protein [Ramlibacter sp. PS3R-8]|uniref:TerB family tellurite resistance protein n=1 Tax=Ramlibacter sp. PS3R-8 TaxID=3133437 RepID=UPI0030A247D2
MPKTIPSLTDFTQAGGPIAEYMTDVMQRTVLYWDVMRQRSDQYYEQKDKDVPHVLRFDGELVLDGRTFERPCNYLLARVRPPAGLKVDPRKRPFVVVDPRAGHGPGIGGFKADSELGVAMKAGHPAYLIGFTPEPMPGQTIEDVMQTEAVFLEKVISLHPGAEGKPCVVGNCQGGWAVLLVAAIRPELFGPIIVAGSPLSYWAGIEGENPMRYTGGLAGGSWMTALAGDLGAGKFDGGMLVENFENLNPSNTLWTKKYNLWSKVDTEGPRYIEFEKWWGGHIDLNAEEMQWIVDNLFVGNKLATAEIVTRDGQRIDLRNIRSPIICFCSKGDNITPPQQALGWIHDLYGSDDDIRACGQTIVYAVHDTVGHLGIFVSGGVAKKEHNEFASNIDLIDVLPPGLYEAVMTPKTAESLNQDAIDGDWIVRFEPRSLEDIRAIVQPSPENERRFATVRKVSETNLALYRSMVQPFVKAFVTQQSADKRKSKKSRRTELPYEIFSGRNPMMKQVARLADQVRAQRQPVAPDNPLVQWQAMVSDGIVAALDGYRDQRDAQMEKIFLAIYDSPVLQAMVGTAQAEPRPRPGMAPERVALIKDRIAELKAGITKGGVREAAVRAFLYVSMADPGVDERAFNTLREMRRENDGLTLEAFKQLVREQYFSLVLDPEGAVAAIPGMLPADAGKRARLLAAIRRTAAADGDTSDLQAERLEQLEKLFQPQTRRVPAKKAPRKAVRRLKS